MCMIIFMWLWFTQDCSVLLARISLFLAYFGEAGGPVGASCIARNCSWPPGAETGLLSIARNRGPRSTTARDWILSTVWVSLQSTSFPSWSSGKTATPDTLGFIASLWDLRQKIQVSRVQNLDPQTVWDSEYVSF